jgi:hypothetical protein
MGASHPDAGRHRARSDRRDHANAAGASRRIDRSPFRVPHMFTEFVVHMNRHRRLITKFLKEELKPAEIVRRIGKDKSALSPEAQRNALSCRYNDAVRGYWFDRGWTYEELNRYLRSQPVKASQTERVASHSGPSASRQPRLWCCWVST